MRYLRDYGFYGEAMKHPLILGLGVTGFAVASYFEKHQIAYYAFDDQIKSCDDFKYPSMQILSKEEANQVFFDVLVVSPGIDPEHFLYKKAQELKIKIVGEIELALGKITSKVIGITGTNGKTTVTKCLQDGLKKLGFNAIACGNYGMPLISLVDEADRNTIFCVELSSYQLETCQSKKLDFGVILNITQDHLDRYKTMEAYAKAKFRMLKMIKPSGKMYIQKKVAADFHHLLQFDHYELLEGQELAGSFFERFGCKERENWAAVYHILKHFGMDLPLLAEFIKEFKKPDHRIELIKVIDEISFYDDSKGTNVDAVIFAVEKFSNPIILLLGGKDKGSDYSPWIQAFKGKVKKIFAYGSAKNIIFNTLSPYFDIEVVEHLEEATQLAYKASSKGDHVLLSPGCSSFDQFKDYKHRAEVFKNCVLTLNK